MSFEYPKISELNESYDNLFDASKSLMKELVVFLNDRGLDTKGGVEVEKANSFLCYYCLNEKKIFLSLPDQSSPFFKIQLEMFKSMLGLKKNSDLFEFVYLFLPWILFHEFGHLLRDRYGKFGEDLWQEEQLANLFGACLFKKVFKPSEINHLSNILTHSFEHLKKELASEEIFKTHREPLAGFYAEGQIDARHLQGVESLMESGAIGGDDENRKNLIQNFNADYTSNLTKYFFYQIGWVLLDLKSPNRMYELEFKRSYLEEARSEQEFSHNIDDRYLSQLAQATKSLKESSPLGSSFFKSLLFDSLISKYADLKNSNESQNYLTLLNDVFQDMDSNSPLLSLLPVTIVDVIKGLLFKDGREKEAKFEKGTFEEQLYLSFKGGKGLELYEALISLFESPLFHELPPKVILKLAHKVIPVHFKAGDIVFFEGDPNYDIFLVKKGKLILEGVTGNDGAEITLGDGSVIGEMAFFTKEFRTATIRAKEDTSFWVLKSSNLDSLALDYPIIYQQIGKTIVQRLA